MKARFFALTVAAAGLAGCSTGYVPPPPNMDPGPAWRNEVQEGRPGLFGDLRYTVDLKTGERLPNPPLPGVAPAAAAPAAAVAAPAAASAAEQEEFKKWRESAGTSERREFEEWRAWQEWKRKNPK